MGPAGSDAAEARAPRPLAVDGGGAQHKTNSRGPRRGLGAQVPRRRGGEAGRGQTPSRGDGITAGFWSRYLTTGVNPRRRGSGERGRLRLRPPQRGPPPVGRSGRRGRGGEGREALRRSRPPRRRARAPAATSAARPGRGTRPLRRGRGGGARGGARQRRPCAELCGGGRAALGWSLR
ncbi:unnamed protein product [Prorocentrum cordatum]|uniref:Uncharacterized protein n=1 Tax=Prorocentrum cordatum TaxID=2364126 RepID=A0ABN9TYU8_9DINO|nr:unnamed protein product [Polarella glacialis]